MVFKAELKLVWDENEKATDNVIIVANSYAEAVNLIEENTFDCLDSINNLEAISPSNFISIDNKELYDKVINDIEENSVW